MWNFHCRTISLLIQDKSAYIQAGKITAIRGGSWIHTDTNHLTDSSQGWGEDIWLEVDLLFLSTPPLPSLPWWTWLQMAEAEQRPAVAFIFIKGALSVKEGCPIESHGLCRSLDFLCEIEINEHVLGSRNSWPKEGGQITICINSMRQTYRCTPGIVGFTSFQYTFESTMNRTIVLVMLGLREKSGLFLSSSALRWLASWGSSGKLGI